MLAELERGIRRRGLAHERLRKPTSRNRWRPPERAMSAKCCDARGHLHRNDGNGPSMIDRGQPVNCATSTSRAAGSAWSAPSGAHRRTRSLTGNARMGLHSPRFTRLPARWIGSGETDGDMSESRTVASDAAGRCRSAVPARGLSTTCPNAARRQSDRPNQRNSGRYSAHSINDSLMQVRSSDTSR